MKKILSVVACTALFLASCQEEESYRAQFPAPVLENNGVVTVTGIDYQEKLPARVAVNENRDFVSVAYTSTTAKIPIKRDWLFNIQGGRAATVTVNVTQGSYQGTEETSGDVQQETINGKTILRFHEHGEAEVYGDRLVVEYSDPEIVGHD